MANHVEPWLRGTHTELDAVRRQVVHALELASEDVTQWAKPLTDAELEQSPLGLPSVAFQLRHMVRSLDRLLTYAEGRALEEVQLMALQAEHDGQARDELFADFAHGMSHAVERIRAMPSFYEAARYVGRDRLPTTLAGLLVHCAEHIQRHAGQMVTIAKVVMAMR